MLHFCATANTDSNPVDFSHTDEVQKKLIETGKRGPDFFIIGAPKCGTTSLATYLAMHPDVYMSVPKEPSFFSTDIPHRTIRTWDDYFTCFEDAREFHQAIGEASTVYLRSDTAVPSILKYKSSAKFIVMVRNPVDMAHALHMELLWNGDEDTEDFERAWYLQEQRRRGEFIPNGNRDPSLLQYKKMCSLGQQLQQLMENVCRENLHVIVFDDFKADSAKEYENVLEFLSINPWSPGSFEKHNESKRLKLPHVAMLLRFLGNIRQRMGIKKSFGILEGIRKINTQNVTRSSLSPGLRETLSAEFLPDVTLLSTLLERDLTHWVRSTGLPPEQSKSSYRNILSCVHTARKA